MAKTKENNLKFIDLFAGIGGFHLALHDLGAKCVFASEWDEPARKTYEKNFQKIQPSLFEKGLFGKKNKNYLLATLQKLILEIFLILIFYVVVFLVSHSAYRVSKKDSRIREGHYFLMF